jgi:integrase
VGLLTNIRFHDLRATSATLLYDFGENPWTIASICGHADPQVGQDHYIHKKIEQQDQAMDKIDESFQKKIEERKNIREN